MKTDVERCKVCNVAFMNGDKILWCKVRGCPETEQTHPTEAHIRMYKIEEKGQKNG